MFQARTKCPNCQGTDLIRSEAYAEYGYQIGECINCRADRGAELPDGAKGEQPAQGLGKEKEYGKVYSGSSTVWRRGNR